MANPMGHASRTGQLVLGVVAIVAAAGGCREDRVLSGEEARALFAGKTVTGYHEKKGYRFKSYYDPAGTFRSYQGGSSTPKHGKWWINESGDECVEWQGESPLCRKIVTDDKGHYWKIKIKRNGKRILIVSFMRFFEGNPEKL
jgi:hypothetical protein